MSDRNPSDRESTEDSRQVITSNDTRESPASAGQQLPDTEFPITQNSEEDAQGENLRLSQAIKEDEVAQQIKGDVIEDDQDRPSLLESEQEVIDSIFEKPPEVASKQDREEQKTSLPTGTSSSTNEQTNRASVLGKQPTTGYMYKAKATEIPQKPQVNAGQNTFEQFMSKDNIYPACHDIEITDSLKEFYQIRKHFLIFSDAGKPIYTRFGDEMILAPFFATLSAVMPKIESYFWDPSVHARQNTNRLHTLRCSGFTATFLKKGSLIYICLYNQAKKFVHHPESSEEVKAPSQDDYYFLDEKEKILQSNDFVETSENHYLRTFAQAKERDQELLRMQNSFKDSSRDSTAKPVTSLGEIKEVKKRLIISSTYTQSQAQRPEPIHEVATFVKKQLEYLHLQFISLMTSSVLTQLAKRPNLDIKSNIQGLERTLDMMCEVSQKSPQCFLQAFQPLRLPISARTVFNEVVQSVEKPQKLAFGMMITSLNVINIFTDEFDSVRPHDISVIFNFFWANPSMKSGQTWTPICVPGCSEEFMLHVYICFKSVNLGLILVCTDHNSFDECHEFSKDVFDQLHQRRYYAGANKPTLTDVVDKCTLQMYSMNDMKEVQMVIVRNNIHDQFTTYNFPLLTRVTSRHEQHLRIFEHMQAQAISLEQQWAQRNKVTEEDARKQLQAMRRNKKNQSVDVVSKQIYESFSLAMVNYTSAATAQAEAKDLSLFLVYDHRINNNLERISKFLFQDLIVEEQNIFIQVL